MKGEEFKRLRKSVGMTQRELSIHLDCTVNSIYQWEAGITKIKKIYELALYKVIDNSSKNSDSVC